MRKLVGLIVVGCCSVLSLACTGGDADASNVIAIPSDIGWTPPDDNGPPSGGNGGGGGGEAGGGNTPMTDAGGDEPYKADINLVWPSTGCGMPLPAEQLPTVPGSREGYTKYSVQQTGETISGNDPSKAILRDFYVRVPFDYDPSRAYDIVYLGMGCGNGQADLATYPLFIESQGGNEQRIYVGISLPITDPVAMTGPNSNCYDNRAGEASMEFEAFELMHTFIESKFCVDNNRIFYGGYSSGGWIASMYGCYFAGLEDEQIAHNGMVRKFAPGWRFRGQAATTGNQPENNPACNGPVGGLWIHDQDDVANPIAGNIAALDRVLEMNDCVGSATAAWGDTPLLSDVCLQYTDCPAEFPVIFCTTVGRGHSDQPERSIPAYNQFFTMMDAPQ